MVVFGPMRSDPAYADGNCLIPTTSVPEPTHPPTASPRARTLTLSPNPCADLVCVEGLRASDVVRVYSLAGELQRSARRPSANVLDLRALAPGVYTVSVVEGSTRTVGHVTVIR